MEEEGKDGTSKAPVVHPPTAKPRPVPRKRNQPRADPTVQNGKPENIPPKPVLLPKPRRPPPNAPTVKPSEPAERTVTNNNKDISINKQPSVKAESITETRGNNVLHNNVPLSGKSINKAVETRNGPTNLDSRDSIEDDQWYQPLRPQAESTLSNCDDTYEDIPAPRSVSGLWNGLS